MILEIRSIIAKGSLVSWEVGLEVSLVKEIMCELGGMASLPLYLARSRNSPDPVVLGIPTHRPTGASVRGGLGGFVEFSNTPSRSRRPFS